MTSIHLGLDVFNFDIDDAIKINKENKGNTAAACLAKVTKIHNGVVAALVGGYLKQIGRA